MTTPSTSLGITLPTTKDITQNTESNSDTTQSEDVAQLLSPTALLSPNPTLPPPSIRFLGLNEDNQTITIQSKTFSKSQEPVEIDSTTTVEEVGNALGRYKPRTRDGKRRKGFLDLNGFQNYQPTMRYRNDYGCTSSTLYGRSGKMSSPYNFQAYIDPLLKAKFEEEQRLKQHAREEEEAKNSSTFDKQLQNIITTPSESTQSNSEASSSSSSSLTTLDEASPQTISQNLAIFQPKAKPYLYHRHEVLESTPSLLGPYYTSLFREVCGIIQYDYHSFDPGTGQSTTTTTTSTQTTTPHIQTTKTATTTSKPGSTTPKVVTAPTPKTRAVSVDMDNLPQFTLSKPAIKLPTSSNHQDDFDNSSGDDSPCEHMSISSRHDRYKRPETTTTTTTNNNNNNSNLPPNTQAPKKNRFCQLCNPTNNLDLPPLTQKLPKILHSALSHRISTADFNTNRALLLKHTLARGFALSLLRHPQAVLVPTSDFDTVPKWLWVDTDGVNLLWSDKPPQLDKAPNFFKRLLHLPTHHHSSSQEILRVDKVLLGVFQRGKNSHKKSALKPWHCITIVFNNIQPKAEKSYDYGSDDNNTNTTPGTNQPKSPKRGSVDDAMNSGTMQVLQRLDPIEIVCRDDEQTRRIFMGLQSLSPLSASTKSYGCFLWKRASLKMRKLAFDKVLLKEEYLQQLWDQAKEYKYERFKKQYLLMKKVNSLRFVIAQTSMLCASQIYYEFLNTVLSTTSNAITHATKLASSSSQPNPWVIRSKGEGFFELDWGRLDQLIAMATKHLTKSALAIRQKRHHNDTTNNKTTPPSSNTHNTQPDSLHTKPDSSTIDQHNDTDIDHDNVQVFSREEIEEILIKKNQMADLIEMCLVSLLPLRQSLSLREIVLARMFLKVYVRRRLVSSMVGQTHSILSPTQTINERQTLRLHNDQTPILFGVTPNSHNDELALDSPTLEKLSSIASINITPLIDETHTSKILSPQHATIEPLYEETCLNDSESGDCTNKPGEISNLKIATSLHHPHVAETTRSHIFVNEHHADVEKPIPEIKIEPTDITDAVRCAITIQTEELCESNRDDINKQNASVLERLQDAQKQVETHFTEQYEKDVYDARVQLLRERKEKLRQEKADKTTNDEASNSNPNEAPPINSTTPSLEGSTATSKLFTTTSGDPHKSVILSSAHRAMLSQFPQDVIAIIQDQISDLLDSDQCATILQSANDNNTYSQPSPQSQHKSLGLESSETTIRKQFSIDYTPTTTTPRASSTSSMFTPKPAISTQPVTSDNQSNNEIIINENLTSPVPPNPLQHPERQKMMRQLYKLSYELQKQLTLDSNAYLSEVDHDDNAFTYAGSIGQAGRFDNELDSTIPSYQHYLDLHRNRRESLGFQYQSSRGTTTTLALPPIATALSGEQINLALTRSKNQPTSEPISPQPLQHLIQQHPQQHLINQTHSFNPALSTLQSKIGLDSHGLREYDLDSVEFLHHCYKFQLEQVQNQPVQSETNLKNAITPGPNQIKAHALFDNSNQAPKSTTMTNQNNTHGSDNEQICWRDNPQIQKHRYLLKNNYKVIEFIAYLRAAMYPHLTGFEDELVKTGVVDLELLAAELLTLSPDTLEQLQYDHLKDGGVQFIGFTRRK